MRANKLLTMRFLLWSIILLSCSSQQTERDYVSWIKDVDNGLHVVEHRGAYKIDVQFTPADYVWLQNRNMSKAGLETLQYYTITITPQDASFNLVSFQASNESERQKRLYYFSYLFQNDLTVKENGTVFPCVMFHFERTSDMIQSRTFVLGFEKDLKNAEESEVIINSKLISSIPISIKISKQHIPSIKL